MDVMRKNYEQLAVKIKSSARQNDYEVRSTVLIVNSI